MVPASAFIELGLSAAAVVSIVVVARLDATDAVDVFVLVAAQPTPIEVLAGVA